MGIQIDQPKAQSQFGAPTVVPLTTPVYGKNLPPGFQNIKWSRHAQNQIEILAGRLVKTKLADGFYGNLFQ